MGQRFDAHQGEFRWLGLTGRMSSDTRESYLSAVVEFLGHRQAAKEVNVVTFLGRHVALWNRLQDSWNRLAEPKGAPSPDQVFTWL